MIGTLPMLTATLAASATLAALIEIGPNALSAVVVLAGVLTTVIQSTRSQIAAKRSAEAAEKVAGQTDRNGGSTLRDAIDRIESRQETGAAAARAEIKAISDRLGVLEAGQLAAATIAATSAAGPSAAVAAIVTPPEAGDQ